MYHHSSSFDSLPAATSSCQPRSCAFIDSEEIRFKHRKHTWIIMVPWSSHEVSIKFHEFCGRPEHFINLHDTWCTFPVTCPLHISSSAGQDIPGLGSSPLARIDVLQAWPLIASLAQFHGFHEASWVMRHSKTANLNELHMLNRYINRVISDSLNRSESIALNGNEGFLHLFHGLSCLWRCECLCISLTALLRKRSKADKDSLQI